MIESLSETLIGIPVSWWECEYHELSCLPFLGWAALLNYLVREHCSFECSNLKSGRDKSRACYLFFPGEPVWPSGKAKAEGPRFDTASAVLSLQKGCGLWTVLWLCPSLPTETLKWLSSLPIFMWKSFWWWQCSDRYIISLSPTFTPFPPFSPSLKSRSVSVDVKHHVYTYFFCSVYPQLLRSFPASCSFSPGFALLFRSGTAIVTVLVLRKIHHRETERETENQYSINAQTS